MILSDYITRERVHYAEIKIEEINATGIGSLILAIQDKNEKYRTESNLKNNSLFEFIRKAYSNVI